MWASAKADRASSGAFMCYKRLSLRTPCGAIAGGGAEPEEMGRCDSSSQQIMVFESCVRARSVTESGAQEMSNVSRRERWRGCWICGAVNVIPNPAKQGLQSYPRVNLLLYA